MGKLSKPAKRSKDVLDYILKRYTQANGKVYNKRGDECGYLTPQGRYKLTLYPPSGKCVMFRSHVIWAIVHKRLATGTLDHQDDDRTNDDIGNLKEMPMVKNWAKSSTTPRGVTEYREGAYMARVICDGVRHYFGSSKCVDEAAEMARQGRELLGVE
jgi:hypothetical protein